MASTSPYKPSPLSFGSPRSPFRRPETPTSPSTIRATSPQVSPTRGGNTVNAPTQLNSPSLANRGPRGPESSPNHHLPAGPSSQHSGFSSPMPAGDRPGSIGANRDALSQLQPAQLRELREAFQTLDRNSDGQVGRDDVADMLSNLAQDTNSSAFFPPGTPQTMTLPAYLTTLASLLAPLSTPSELLSAFAAFDEDDSGQVDVADLRDALLHTVPEPGRGGRMMSEREIDQALNGFTGRRAFSKQGVGKKGDVFRYQEFVASISGGSAVGQTEGKTS